MLFCVSLRAFLLSATLRSRGGRKTAGFVAHELPWLLLLYLDGPRSPLQSQVCTIGHNRGQGTIARIRTNSFFGNHVSIQSGSFDPASHGFEATTLPEFLACFISRLSLSFTLPLSHHPPQPAQPPLRSLSLSLSLPQRVGSCKLISRFISFHFARSASREPTKSDSPASRTSEVKVVCSKPSLKKKILTEVSTNSHRLVRVLSIAICEFT